MKISLAFVFLLIASTSHAQFRTPETALHMKSVERSTAAVRVVPEDSVAGRVVAPNSRVYNVNPWVDGAITVAGGAIGLLALNGIRFKPEITNKEFDALNRDIINGFDRWALDVQTIDVAQLETLSTIMQGASAVVPLAFLFTDRIKEDWGHILLMYAEATAVTISIYVASPMGPQFQSRFRPSVYDESQTRDYRRDGNHRNSFYSGHVATASVATFFFAKVYSDYHPEMGMDKYWLYAAATLPPLLMGYFRIKAHDHFPSDILTGLGIGALCGILIPEFHRISCNNLSFGAYSGPGGSNGVTVQWMPSTARN